ncbi:MAG: Rieske 2Fe-2S domain-containing protein [Nitrososphaeria archaeon]
MLLIWHNSKPLLIVKTDEKFYAMEAICAHMGCALLSEVNRTTAVCPAHGAMYDVRTGELIEKPVVKPEVSSESESLKIPLKTYNFSVSADGFLEISP